MIHPVGDNLKIEVGNPDKFGMGTQDISTETGLVIEVPDAIHYFGKHNFSFEQSFMSKEQLKELLNYFKSFIGKRVWWEAFQDKGRRFIENDKEYVYLKMSDILMVSDNINDTAKPVEDTRSGGFKI